MKFTKHLFALFVFILISIPTFSFADGIMPYADPEFQQAYISFYADKEALFECSTYEPKDTLYVKNCQLQKKVGNTWVNIGDSTKGTTRYNANLYSYSKKYSISASGTYRVKGTFVADGYTLTKYSSERTFN